ncbi:hypothetical protein ACLOJK_014722 [Asimina triloba]
MLVIDGEGEYIERPLSARQGSNGRTANQRQPDRTRHWSPVGPTRGLKYGRAIVVSTCAAVASIVTGVLAGILSLGEHLPSAPVARLSLLLGWIVLQLLIIMGVISLVSSTRLAMFLPWRLRRLVVKGNERNNLLKRTGSVRSRDSGPSTFEPENLEPKEPFTNWVEI